MTMPQVGEKAPSFVAQDDEGHEHRLADYRGKTVVLYFYPRDDTAGCTKEACGFRDQLARLKSAGAIVLGVSRDDAKSHQKFRTKYELNFPLLVDVDGKISNSYGTWVEKSMYGRTYMGMQRSTFLIAPDGFIARVWEKAKPEGHAEEVLEAIKSAPAKARK